MKSDKNKTSSKALQYADRAIAMLEALGPQLSGRAREQALDVLYVLAALRADVGGETEEE